MSTSYHAVRGVKRHGLLYDLGAPSGIIGTDTVREYQGDILNGASIMVMPAWSHFTGIDGKPTPGIGNVVVPLKMPAMRGATLTGDVIGGSGSWCPGLMPLSISIRYRAVMLAAVFYNGDGIRAIFPDSLQRGLKATPTYIGLLHADSGHYRTN